MEIYVGNTSILYILFFFLSVSILFLILKLYKKENTKYYFLYGMFMTKRGLEKIKEISKNKFFKYYEYFSIFFGILIIISAIYFVIYGIIRSVPTYMPVIPGAKIGGIQIPFIQTIIAIFIAAFVHEISHAILSYRNNLDVKYWGFFFLGPFLGAFVEPNEEELEKIDEKRKIAIFNVGSVTNIVVGLIFLLIYLAIIIFVLPYIGSPYIEITGTIPNTSAYNLNVSGIIESINGIKVYTLSQLSSIMSNYHVGQSVILETTSGKYNITLTYHNGRAVMGVYLVQMYSTSSSSSFLISLIEWISLINIGIGIANMLPIYPLDGGRALESLFRLRFKKETARKLTMIFSLIILFLILFNISYIFM